MTINDIIAIGRQIAAETAEGGNTAARVGGVIEAIGEALKNQDYMSWQPAGNFDIEEYYEKNDQVFDEETNSCYLSLQTDNVGHPVNENDESYEEGWWMKVIDGASVLSAAAAATQAAAEANQAAEAARGIVYQAVDDHLDTESLKPVANQVVTQAINNLSENLQDVEEELSAELKKDSADINILKDAHFRLHQDAVKRSNIVDININKEQMLLAMSRHINIPTSFTTSSKRLTLAWCSDVHSDLKRWARFIDYCNYYKDILDAAVVTGDLNQTWDFDMGWEMLMDYAKEHLEIPIIPVIGNHDASGDKVGGHNALASGSVDWLGENYITPYIDEDCVQGEKDGVKQAYFYRDFAASKIRVISINDYDMPRWAGCSHFLSPSENEDLSEAIPATNGMSLTTGNIYTWRGLYFKVAQTVTFNCARTFPRTDYYGGQYKFPFSHTGIWGRYISQAQADFLVDALNSVPSGYNVVIASHLLLDNTRGGVAADEKWNCRNANSNMGIAYCQNGYILQDILSAYMNKTTLSKSYAPQVENASAGGGASLASDWRYPTVTVEADFSSAQGSVICQLAGHLHEDVAIWSGRMTDAELLLIGAPSNCFHPWLENESNGAWQCGDIYKGENKPDIFNVISFDTTDKAIQLLRIGADMTDRMEERVSTRISYINN
jgi:hypothetical protein